MTYSERKERRIDIYPPLGVKKKAAMYSKGNMTEFITDAINEKVARIQASNKEVNSVTKLLG